MTLRLILMRHAKSGWEDPDLDDHDRPLTERGRRAADAIGGWLAEHDFVPDLVLSSTSRRTVESWKLVAPHLPEAEVEFSSALYLAAPGEMLGILQTRLESTVLILAHNPGTAMLAAALADSPSTNPKFRSYPSGATCVLDFDIAQWRDIQPGSGRIVDFVAPRDIV